MARAFDHEHNPLAFLDKLLDEERDTNLFFGDVRFWQHVEFMDTNQIYRTKSLEYRTMKLMFCEAIFYAMFLFVLTGFIIEQRSNSIYESRRQQLDYWGDCRTVGHIGKLQERRCTMDDVKDPTSLMAWLRTVFVPKVFTDQDEFASIADVRGSSGLLASIYRLQSGTPAWKPHYVGDTRTSVLVGAVRLRQLRVFSPPADQCYVLEDFQSFGEDCFPQFNLEYESKMPWSQEWTPPYLEPHYAWFPENMTHQAEMAGHYATYPGSGFVLNLPIHRDLAIHRLTELEEWLWLDERTRAVIVELSTLNLNVNMFVHYRMLFEFPATGGTVARQEAFAFRAIQLSMRLMATDEFSGAFAYFILTCNMHLLLFVYVCWVIKKNGSRFFTYFWSYCDILILTIFFIWLMLNAAIYDWTSTEPNLAPEVIADPAMLFPIGKVIDLLDISSSLLAALGLVAWIKIIKYFSLSDMFHAFVRVIERCIVNLLCFTGLLFVVLFGFAVAFYVGYGNEGNLFSTLRGSFVAVMVAPAGGVDFTPVFARDDMLGPVLVFCYIIVIVLLLLNTFMAICVDTYSVCTFEIGEVYRLKPEHPTSIFVWTYVNALRGVKLVGRESEEDKGAEDEQQILLSSLPEPIQAKFLETRGRMRAILDSAESQMLEEKLAKLVSAGSLEPEEADARMKASRKGKSAVPGAIQGAAPGTLAITDSYSNTGNSMPTPVVFGASNGDAFPGFDDDNPQAAPADDDPTQITVNRVQLQRMLEDDPALADMTGTQRAVDLVRRFRVDQSGVDPYEAVAQLQAAVTKKLKELEEKGARLTFNETEMLRSVSQELHSALTESQKEWRAELLTIMQMSNLLTNALVELTKKLENVQTNHNDLAMKAKGA